MTVDLILDAQRIWIHRHGAGRYYNIIPRRAELIAPIPVELAVLDHSEGLPMHPGSPSVFFRYQWEEVEQTMEALLNGGYVSLGPVLTIIDITNHVERPESSMISSTPSPFTPVHPWTFTR